MNVGALVNKSLDAFRVSMPSSQPQGRAPDWTKKCGGCKTHMGTGVKIDIRGAHICLQYRSLPLPPSSTHTSPCRHRHTKSEEPFVPLNDSRKRDQLPLCANPAMLCQFWRCLSRTVRSFVVDICCLGVDQSFNLWKVTILFFVVDKTCKRSWCRKSRKTLVTAGRRVQL